MAGATFVQLLSGKGKGVGKPEGGHRRKLPRNSEIERRGGRCKILYIRRVGGGALLFSFPFINWKNDKRAIRV